MSDQDDIANDPEGSRRIYLSGKHSDKYALVDEKWYEELSKYKWRLSTKGYAERHATLRDKVTGRSVRLHRFVLGITDNRIFVDHKDRNRLNDLTENLRPCTPKQNSHNRSPNKFTASQYKGVTWHKRINKWHVSLTINDKTRHGGYFLDERLAGLRYDQLAREYSDEYAYYNFPLITNYSEVNEYLESIKPNYSSKYIGVSWHKIGMCWCARIKVKIKGKNIGMHLGMFDDEISAARAYDQAITRLGLNRKANFNDSDQYDISPRFKPLPNAWALNELEFLTNNYKEWSTDAIAIKLGRTTQAICAKRTELKLKKGVRKYKLNLKYFDEITDYNVYWVGYWRGKACFKLVNNCTYIHFSSTDVIEKKHFLNMLSDMDSNRPVKIYHCDGRTHYKFFLISKELMNGYDKILSNLDILTRSQKLNFIRGCIDSFGSIYESIVKGKPRFAIALNGDREILTWIQDTINKELQFEKSMTLTLDKSHYKFNWYSKKAMRVYDLLKSLETPLLESKWRW